MTTRDGPARIKRMCVLTAIPAATRIQAILDALPRTKHARSELPFILHRVVTPAMPGFHAAFVSLLVDPDPGTRQGAAQVLFVRPRWAVDLVPALSKMAAFDLPRKRTMPGMGAAFDVLGVMQTTDACAALLAMERATFAQAWVRARWVQALGEYRSAAVARVLARFTTSRDLKVRTAALCGRVRNGDRRAITTLRTMLDLEPVDHALSVAWEVHFALKVRLAISEDDLVRLRAWWDAHPETIERLFEAAKTAPRPTRRA
ncbi:MAG: hypothetical protein NT062_15780 [Proteobacteria bacterium]|nr:hypothetical protein [Pseudomonadota bacterium]